MVGLADVVMVAPLREQPLGELTLRLLPLLSGQPLVCIVAPLPLPFDWPRLVRVVPYGLRLNTCRCGCLGALGPG